jgi:uncharacterized protein YmfQ (DUF2313 family)
MSDTAHDPAALGISWDDSHNGAMALLPTGPVWPRHPDSTASRTVRGMVGVHWRAWRRVSDLLRESDPRATYETLRMWEIDCGLPDPCVANPPTSIEGRRAAVLTRRQEGGTTTPMDFINLAATLGYQIRIDEFRPFRVWSRCDDFLNTDTAATGVGPDENRAIGWPHCWRVNVLNGAAVFHMTCRSPCTAFLREWVRGDLECLFERIKPAHTRIIWAYAGVTP